jgi:hypothetical protein
MPISTATAHFSQKDLGGDWDDARKTRMKRPKWPEIHVFLLIFTIRGHHPPWVDDLGGNPDYNPPRGHHPPLMPKPANINAIILNMDI